MNKFVLSACLAGLVPTQAYAQDPSVPVGVEATVSASSAYVWRAMMIGDRPAVQPSVAVTFGGVTVTSWGNLWHAGEGRALSEHDLTVAYTRTVGDFEVGGGWTNYFFTDPQTGRHSNELHGEIGWTGPLEPVFAIDTDVQEGSGTYASLGVSRTLREAGRYSVAASASLGYNHHSWTDTSGLSDATFILRADYSVTGHLRLAPVLTAFRSLDPAIGRSRLVWGLEAGIR